MGSLVIALIVAFVLLAILDVVLTSRILARGGREMNIIMRTCMSLCGEVWWIPKMAATCALAAAAAYLLDRTWAPRALGLMCLLQAGVDAWNYRVWRGMK